MTHILTEPSMQTKPFAAGSGIEFKELGDKILITGQSRTLIKEGNFTLDSDVIHIEAGPGIKISSKGKDTLVISCNLTKFEEQMYELKKEIRDRLEVVEKAFTQIIKSVKK